MASAQVIIRSQSGKRITGDTLITAETIRDYQPAEEDVDAARAAFTQAGFETGPCVGISFSITAAPQTFERFFATRLRVDERGVVAPDRGEGPDGLELPLGALPGELSSRLVTVTFSPPAELFGGGSSTMP